MPENTLKAHPAKTRDNRSKPFSNQYSPWQFRFVDTQI